MRDNRALARWIAGLLVAGTVAIGAAAPAQAQNSKDSGWNGTVAPSGSTSTTMRPCSDSGWNGT